MDELILTPAGEGIQARRTLEDQSDIMFYASNIRQERTGVHAKVAIGYATTIIDYDTFNIERREDRQRLASSVHKGFNPALQTMCPVAFLKHDLDTFCRLLWAAFQRRYMARDVAGTEATPVEYVLKPLVVDLGGTVIFAPPGRGKSWTGICVAVCIHHGVNELFQVQQRRCMLINLERSAKSVARRLGAVNRALGLPYNATLPAINARGRTLHEVHDAVKLAVHEQGIECGVLDSVSRAGVGDLNENQPMNRIMDMLNETLPTWVALAHTPRQDETHAFGSIMLDCAADVVVKLLSEPSADTLGVGLEITKANDLPKQPMTVLRLGFDPELSLTSIERAKVEDFPSLAAGRVMQLADQIDEWLADINQAVDAATIAEAVGKSRQKVSTELANNKRFVVVGKVGKRLMYGRRASSYQLN